MKEVKIGLIGLGFIGRLHAQAYRTIPYVFSAPAVFPHLAAVLRTRTGGSSELIYSLGDPLVTTDPDEFFAALAGSQPAIVDICTPNHTHLPYARDALRRGLPVYCEKPLARSLAEAQEMTEADGAAHVPTHVAFMLRYLPAVRQVKALVEGGALGRLFHFRAFMFHGSYLDPERPTAWRLAREYSGGGSLADLGSHLIDLLRYFLGEVAWVRAETRTFIKDRPAGAGSGESQARVPIDVDDWACLTLAFKNGAVGTLETTRMAAGARDDTAISLFGSRGSAHLDSGVAEESFGFAVSEVRATRKPEPKQ